MNAVGKGGIGGLDVGELESLRESRVLLVGTASSASVLKKESCLAAARSIAARWATANHTERRSTSELPGTQGMIYDTNYH
jgi:hypothetical protein